MAPTIYGIPFKGVDGLTSRTLCNVVSPIANLRAKLEEAGFEIAEIRLKRKLPSALILQGPRMVVRARHQAQPVSLVAPLGRSLLTPGECKSLRDWLDQVLLAVAPVGGQEPRGPGGDCQKPLGPE